LPSGTIIKGIGGFYYVDINGTVYECKARGVFRKNGITPLVGDKVVIEINDDEKKLGFVTEILERETELIRPSVANVNQLAAVIAVKSPAPDFLLLDKLLVTAAVKNIEAFICINKIDLDTEGESADIAETYIRAGYKVIYLTSKSRTEDNSKNADINCITENNDIAENTAANNSGFLTLREMLEGRVTVFAGQSGVGKSTILNNIMDSMIMKTGNVSRKIERGRHTTRHAELLRMKTKGYVVDTPGFSSFELADIKASELYLYYKEFNTHFTGCRFNGCVHISEPGCSIKSAVEKGLINSGRYERYNILYNYLKENENNKYTKRTRT